MVLYLVDRLSVSEANFNKERLSPFLWGFWNWIKFKIIKPNIQGPIQPCCKWNKCNLAKILQKGGDP